ncbi:MAG: coiled-coil domain-containing protein [Rhodoglobus sp.]
MSVTAVRSGAMIAALALVLSGGFIAPAFAAQDAYPSWEEIEAARGNEAATATTISAINTALDGLQAQAAELGDAAVARQAESTVAQAAFDRATRNASALATSAALASEDAEESAATAAHIAAALYRSGGTDLTGRLLLLGEDESSQLLNQLGTLDRLGSQVDKALDQAQKDFNLSTSLSEQAEIARKERERLATSAQTALDAARSASSAADAAVGEQQQRLSTLYAQLASLKNTTVELEQQYRIGQTNQTRGDSDGSDGSGTGSSGDDGSGDGSGGTGDSGGSDGSGDPGTPGDSGSSDPGTSGDPGGFTVPGNEVNDATAAQSFAYGQASALGWGPDQHYCLLLLWNRESGWRTNAYNASSGAYGIPQSLPGSKMADYAADWRTNYQTQVMWGLYYILDRYDSPCGAWDHSESVGWY